MNLAEKIINISSFFVIAALLSKNDFFDEKFIK